MTTNELPLAGRALIDLGQQLATMRAERDAARAEVAALTLELGASRREAQGQYDFHNGTIAALAQAEAEVARLREEEVDCPYCLGCGQEGPSGEDCGTCWGKGVITVRQVEVACLKAEHAEVDMRARAEQAEAEVARLREALESARAWTEAYRPLSELRARIDAALAAKEGA